MLFEILYDSKLEIFCKSVNVVMFNRSLHFLIAIMTKRSLLCSVFFEPPRSYIGYFLQLQRVVIPKSKITRISQVKSLYSDFSSEEHLNDFYDDLKLYETLLRIRSEPTSFCPSSLRKILESKPLNNVESLYEV